LATVTDASGKIQTAERTGPELALASAWQLALAMDAQRSIETAADNKVRVQISLPVDR
jgi:hypothetical protein